MAVHAATISYSGNKHCFLTIDQKTSTRNMTENIHQVPVYKCEYDDDRVAYFSVLNHIPLTITQDLLYLNGLYAQKIGIKDEEQVVLQLMGQTSCAVTIETEPLSTDDWEIVEKHANIIEDRLLDQVRVVWKGQIIPVWVGKCICIFLRIEKITPEEECVVLNNDTEVLVAPKLFNASGRQPQVKDKRHKRRHSDPEFSNSLLIPTTEGSGHDRVTKSKSPTSRRRSDKARRNKSDVSTNGLEATYTRPILRRQSSIVERIMGWSWLNRWIGSYNYSNLENHSELSYRCENFVIKEHHMIFRVQSLKFSCNPEKLEVFKGPSPYSAITNNSFEILESNQDEDLPPLELFQPSTIFVNHRDVMKILDGGTKKSLPSVFYAELRKLKSPKETEEDKKSQPTTPKINTSQNKNSKEDNSKEEGSSHCCVVRIVTIDKTTDLSDERWQNTADRILEEQTLLSGHALVPDILRRQMKLDVTGRLWLQTVQNEPLATIATLHLYPLTVVPRFVNDVIFIKAFKNFIRWVANDDHPMVVFQGMLIKFMVTEGLHIEAQMVFKEPTPGENRQKYMLLSISNFSDINIVVERTLKDEHLICPQLPYSHVQDFDPIAPNIQLSNLGAVNHLSTKAIRHLETCLLPKPLSEDLFSSCLGLNHGILLISGPKGCGKSSLAQAVCRKMAEVPNMVFTVTVDCKPLRGKRVDKIQETLELLFDEAAWRQPSIVLLEDLHIIAGAANSPDAEVTGEAIYNARVAEVITSVIKYLIKNNTKVAIIATSLSQSSLHPTLVTSRGIHFIQEVISIRPPKKGERKQIFTKMLENRVVLCKNLVEKIELDHIVNKTEGFVARDLENVIDRAIHAKCLVDWRACSAGDIELSDDEFSVALDGFKPTSFRNVSLHVGEMSSWQDVGGMKNIKDILIETLQWPTKYPTLFANCPLRLRTGLLLYGAPGTGKTLIAGVVAKECGLNFISVKGPEVLSKYIGASEQAVRDLFIRAQSAKPCILFFDEFDSMAPRRGHDNTGVTDRVVNQLLTQLDGVEGLEGVYVLAATSRPDLIDGALLRPGRIDKCLHCGLPTEEERVEILEALSSKMSLNEDVDLELIASKSEYFTGADLKAVLYNAQLEAIHATTGFSLDDSFSDRVSKKSLADEGRDNITSEEIEMKAVIQKVREGNYEIQAVEKATVLRQTSSMSENLNSEEKKVERPTSFHGDMTALVQPIEDRVVAMIPNLHDGSKELSNEEEDQILNMIRGLQRRNDLQKQAKAERRESVHGGRDQVMIQVNQKQLLKALYSTRPSVSEEERLRYQYIYDTFTSSRSGNFSPAITKAGQKATLA